MINKHSDNIKNGHRISIILILCLFGFCLVQAMQAPKSVVRSVLTETASICCMLMNSVMICLVAILMHRL